MNCNGPFQLKNTVVSENEYLTHVSVTFSPGKKTNKKNTTLQLQNTPESNRSVNSP